MANEQGATVPNTETVIETPVSPIGETPPVSETPAPDPHPLEPGGRRFEEVYARMKDAERRAQEQAERVARLEGQVSVAQRPAQPQQQFYSVEVIQAAIDRGQITPAAGAQQLAWQQTQIAGQQYAAQARIQEQIKTALAEVRQYMDKIPALNDSGSPEITKVANAARDIAEEMGLTMDDPRVQRRALRETFSTLDRVTARAKTQEADRQSRVPHAESGGGGGAALVVTNGDDPLKGVDPKQLAYWKRLNYTPAKMAEEAKYYRNRTR